MVLRVHRVGWVANELEPSEQADLQKRAAGEQFLALQPRLDGSGGQVFGDFGPLGFVTLLDRDQTPPSCRPS